MVRRTETTPDQQGAMRDAYEAFDLAYYRSQTNDDLLKHTAAVSKALAEVRRHVRANQS